MDLRQLSPAVLKMIELGDTSIHTDEMDYRTLGIGPEDIPALVGILREAPELWESWQDDLDDPEIWAPIHAWRALGQLRAEAAIPALVDALRFVEEEGSEMVQEELPEVFGQIGPAAIPALTAYLARRVNPVWARVAAAQGLERIAQHFPAFRGEVVNTLTKTLERYVEEAPAFNSFIIDYLMELKAVEAAPLVERAYAAGEVDERIIGDWEDYQVEMGLLEKRLTPSRLPPIHLLEDGPAAALGSAVTPPPTIADGKGKKARSSRAELKASQKHKKQKRKKKNK